MDLRLATRSNGTIIRGFFSLFWCLVVVVSGMAAATNDFTMWNKTQTYELQMTRMLCIDTPYLVTELLECRITLRRNQMPLLHVVIHVPDVYTYIVIQYRLYYKFKTYQPFLIGGELEVCTTLTQSEQGTLHDPLTVYALKVLKHFLPGVIVPCPHGNRTYVVDSVFRKEYAPQSVPAGDYRMDLRFATRSNVTMLSLQGFFSARRKGILGSMLECAKAKDTSSDMHNRTRIFQVQIKRFVCVETPYQQTELLECRTVLRRNRLPLFLVSLRAPQTIDYAMIHLKLNYKFNTYQPFLINDQVEGCEYLRTLKNDPFSIYVYDVVRQILPALVRPCPQGKQTYNQTIEFKESYAPKSVPAGDYRFDVRISNRENVTLIAVEVFDLKFQLQ
uniref:Uncharacterized protein n=1 Tax=Anopheles stephensi TaxID=30069 RepID=A0A182Y6N0_ANOST